MPPSAAVAAMRTGRDPILWGSALARAHPQPRPRCSPWAARRPSAAKPPRPLGPVAQVVPVAPVPPTQAVRWRPGPRRWPPASEGGSATGRPHHSSGSPWPLAVRTWRRAANAHKGTSGPPVVVSGRRSRSAWAPLDGPSSARGPPVEERTEASSSGADRPKSLWCNPRCSLSLGHRTCKAVPWRRRCCKRGKALHGHRGGAPRQGAPDRTRRRMPAPA
mmetsp:Transcript_15516/g.32787  ORF Transcript_15516/g.32787 Transcript_15516/m.32787 type:complete len:219 (+) Transcript_15516:173-829(+)